MKTTLLAGLPLLALLAVAGTASAHALGADCTLRGGRVEVEAYFSDDTDARGATVRVLDGQGKALAEGHTDERGRWSFPAPPPGRYTVVVDAGAGHLARVRLNVPGPADGRAAPAATVPADTVRLSEGPTREEFTRFPWPRVGLGVGLIAALGLAGWAVRQRWRRRAAPPAPDGTS
jgi:nickel transport protein